MKVMQSVIALALMIAASSAFASQAQQGGGGGGVIYGHDVSPDDGPTGVGGGGDKSTITIPLKVWLKLSCFTPDQEMMFALREMLVGATDDQVDRQLKQLRADCEESKRQ